VAFLTMMNIFSRGWAMLVSVQVVGSWLVKLCQE
jgi:hypothetical protein